MGKIGAYEYPDISLRECEKIAKIVEDKLDREVKIEALATLLGHKDHRSGAYRLKLASLKRWGLSDGKKLTDLADKLLHPMEGEKWTWIFEAIRNVQLFWELLKRNPDQIPSFEDFWKELVAICQVSRGEAEKEAKKIYPIYKDAIEYLIRLKPKEISIREITAGIKIHKEKPHPKQTITKDEEMDEWAFLQSEYFLFKIKKDIELLDFVKQQFDLWINFVKKKLESKKNISE